MKTKRTNMFMHCYPGMVAVITAKHGDKMNVMAAGWHSFISIEPPIFGVAIGEERFTHHLVKESGQFAVNYLPAEEYELIQQVGRSSGKDMNKFEQFQIPYEQGEVTNCPIMEKAYISYECNVMDVNRYGDHDWFVGSIDMFHIDESRFRDNKLPDWENLSIPMYVGRSEYLLVKGDQAKTKWIDIE